MKPTSYLIPARADLVVIDPETRKPLPQEGAEVTLTTYWQRRLADGDVTVGIKPAPKKPEKGAK